MKNLYQRRARRKPVPVRVEPAADVVFVVGGVQAALHSHASVRSNVISDVSQVLNCDPAELDFLFNDDASQIKTNDIFDFPDAHRRRLVIRNNHLDAAE